MTLEKHRINNPPTQILIGGRRVDRRTIEAKRYESIIGDLADDCGGEPSTVEWLLIHRIAGLTVQCEAYEAKIASGEPIDIEEYTKLTRTLVTVLNRLGSTKPVRDRLPDSNSIDGHAAALTRISTDG